MKDIYILLANQLKDIHHRLSTKITESKQHKPSWEVFDISGTLVVADLSEIQSLILTLERLAKVQQEEPGEMLISGIGNTNG